MRTTVDLPESVHQRARELAASRGLSLSAVIAELTIRGLAASGDPLMVTPSGHSRFPTISLGGGPITSDDVAAALDDE